MWSLDWISLVMGAAIYSMLSWGYILWKEETEDDLQDKIDDSIDKNNKNLIDELVKRKVVK